MSSPKMKGGKLPIESKPQTRRISAEEAFGGGAMALPQEIQDEFEAKGWVPRWLNAAEVYKNQGYHSKGWKIYRRPTPTKAEFQFGQDPDGIVRRGDSILGYKDAEAIRIHRTHLQQRRDSELGKRSMQAADLRSVARQAGVKTYVEEGDDGDE